MHLKRSQLFIWTTNKKTKHSISYWRILNFATPIHLNTWALALTQPYLLKNMSTLAEGIRTRNNIIQKVCGLLWGSSASIRRISALGLVYWTAEYAAPVWRTVNMCITCGCANQQYDANLFWSNDIYTEVLVTYSEYHFTYIFPLNGITYQ